VAQALLSNTASLLKIVMIEWKPIDPVKPPASPLEHLDERRSPFNKERHESSPRVAASEEEMSARQRMSGWLKVVT
jgi:hypothetical protein